jgi:hypothetical protein
VDWQDWVGSSTSFDYADLRRYRVREANVVKNVLAGAQVSTGSRFK